MPPFCTAAQRSAQERMPGKCWLKAEHCFSLWKKKPKPWWFQGVRQEPACFHNAGKCRRKVLENLYAVLCHWWASPEAGSYPGNPQVRHCPAQPHFPPPEPRQLPSHHRQLCQGSAWQLLENPQEDCSSFLLGSTQTSVWRRKANAIRLLSTSPLEAMVLGGYCDSSCICSSCMGNNPLSHQDINQLSSLIPHGLKGLCLTLAGTSTAPAQPGDHRHLLHFFTWLGIIRTAQNAVASIIHHNHNFSLKSLRSWAFQQWLDLWHWPFPLLLKPICQWTLVPKLQTELWHWLKQQTLYLFMRY